MDGMSSSHVKITREEPPNAARSKLERYLSISTYKGVKKGRGGGREDQ